MRIKSCGFVRVRICLRMTGKEAGRSGNGNCGLRPDKRPVLRHSMEMAMLDHRAFFGWAGFATTIGILRPAFAGMHRAHRLATKDQFDIEALAMRLTQAPPVLAAKEAGRTIFLDKPLARTAYAQYRGQSGKQCLHGRRAGSQQRSVTSQALLDLGAWARLVRPISARFATSF